MKIIRHSQQTTKVIRIVVKVEPFTIHDLYTDRNSLATEIRITEIWGERGYRRDVELWGFRIHTNGTPSDVLGQIDPRTADQLTLEAWAEENV